MQKHKFLPALVLFPTACVLLVFSSLLKYPLSAWAQPREVLFHALIVMIVYAGLRRRLSALSALTGSLLFGVSPGHAFVWAAGPAMAGWGGLEYAGTLAIAIAAAFGFERFYAFLKTQENVVRYLFLMGVGALIAGMALMSVQINGIWTDEVSLWRWRAAHYPSPASLNAWGKLLHQKFGKTREAIDIYKKSLNADPRGQEAYFTLAAIYQELGKPQEAIGVYNQLLGIYPDDEKVMTKVVAAYNAAADKDPVYREKREEVLAEYEQLTKRKKYGASDFFNLGFLYEQVGGREEALRFYRKALELDPKYDKPLYHLAGLYKEAGDLKTAMTLYERLLRVNNKFAPAYLNMGIIYNALGDTDRARYLYQKTVAIDPANADGYFNLGYLSEAKGELKEAIAFYEKTVEADPKYAEAYYNMGNVYATLTQYPEAMAAYLKTVGINPNHQNAYVNLSILSFKSRDFQGALRYLEEARLLGYNPPDAYLKTLEPYKNKK